MEEGREIEAGSATETSNKVVRLPRDWLGPPEELVPFGQSVPPPTEPDVAGFAPNDFWGERAAAIHSAIQAPEVEAPPEQPAPQSTRKLRLGRWHLAAAAFAGIAAAATVVLLSGGTPNHAVGGARLNIAAILNNGVSRILNAGPPRVIPHATSSRTPRPVKHVRHRSPRQKPPPAIAQHHSEPSRVSTYVAHASRPSPQPTYHPSVSAPTPHIVTTPHHASSTTSSVASVSPTGQNGALGPVKSPNG